MECKKCGLQINDNNISICPRCGSFLSYQQNNNITYNQPRGIIKVEKGKNNKSSKFVITLIVVLLWAVAIYLFVSYYGSEFYFSGLEGNNSNIQNQEAVSKSGQSNIVAAPGITSIVYDNQFLNYSGLKNESEVLALIKNDSVKQKGNCPSEILEIENEIINNYGIYAVNLCEMEYGFATELLEVTKYIYENYPTARGYLTNMTLANVEEGVTYMAAFMPIFKFITSNSSNEYPLGIKTQIILNAQYFLNKNRIDSSVSYGSNTGYFPPNATRYSAVAHEFGHYLSYIAMLNNYKMKKHVYVKGSDGNLLYSVYQDFNDGEFSFKIVKSAHSKYVSSGGSMTFDEFRASISKYAMAKDKVGNYIYDETIAEAFHDYYLNGSSAKLASRMIVEELKSYL